MKKLLLVLPMAFLLVGCGNKKNEKEVKYTAEKNSEKIFNAGKTVLLEASASGDDFGYVVISGDIYTTTAKDLFANGEIGGENPFETKANDGGMTITFDLTTGTFDATVSGTMYGYKITFDGFTFKASK